MSLKNKALEGPSFQRPEFLKTCVFEDSNFRKLKFLESSILRKLDFAKARVSKTLTEGCDQGEGGGHGR